jgi:hypothetical protein
MIIMLIFILCSSFWASIGILLWLAVGVIDMWPLCCRNLMLPLSFDQKCLCYYYVTACYACCGPDVAVFGVFDVVDDGEII